MGNAVATKPNTPTQLPATKAPATIDELIRGDQFRAAVEAALPKHLKADRFIRIALTARTRTPKLKDCDPSSFFQCLLTLSQLGLEPDGRRAHLVPFENRKRGVVECQLLVDYKGLVELVMRSGRVSNIHADVVCDNDLFEYDRGEIKKHVIDLRKPRGNVYAAYALVRFKDGTEKCEVMSRDEIEAIRRRSRASSNGPWVTDWNEMAKKGLSLDTPIPTPDGWTTMGEIKAGGIVFDKDGNQTTVLAVSEVKHLPCYRLTFSNGESIICDDEHRWLATIGPNGAKARKQGWPVYTVNDLYAAKQRGDIVSMPVAGAIECGWQDLPIHPWSLGYWLGNGTAIDGNVTCHTADRDEVVSRMRACGYDIGAVRQDPRSLGCAVGMKGMRVALRAAGVLGAKKIPLEYMRAPREQREALLAGLMDSDGHIDKSRGRAIFASTDVRLAEQVLELVCSLGETAVMSSRVQHGYGKDVECFRVAWTPSFCPCTLSRKARNFRTRRIAQYRGVKSIEQIESVPTRCIAVDSPSKTYLAGRSMIPTHNTVFRRLTKWVELSPELRDAVEADDDHVDLGTIRTDPLIKTTVTLDQLTELPEPPQNNDESQEVYGGVSAEDESQEVPDLPQPPPAAQSRGPKPGDKLFPSDEEADAFAAQVATPPQQTQAEPARGSAAWKQQVVDRLIKECGREVVDAACVQMELTSLDSVTIAQLSKLEAVAKKFQSARQQK